MRSWAIFGTLFLIVYCSNLGHDDDDHENELELKIDMKMRKFSKTEARGKAKKF